jgi:hypothetical protein
MEEERRLFYVAVTRAKDELYLLYPIIYSGYDGEVIMRPSRFVEDLPPETYEKWEVEEEEGIGEGLGIGKELLFDMGEYKLINIEARGQEEVVDIKDLDFLK